MAHRPFFGIALVVGVALAAARWCAFAADEKGDRAPRAANAKSRRDAAKKVYEGAWESHVQDPGQGPGNVEFYHDWSVRWMQAERDLGRTKAEQISAVEAHLKRMQFWKEMMDKNRQLGQETSYGPKAAEFFRIEADDWLAAAKAGAK